MVQSRAVSISLAAPNGRAATAPLVHPSPSPSRVSTSRRSLSWSPQLESYQEHTPVPASRSGRSGRAHTDNNSSRNTARDTSLRSEGPLSYDKSAASACSPSDSSPSSSRPTRHTPIRLSSPRIGGSLRKMNAMGDIHSPTGMLMSNRLALSERDESQTYSPVSSRGSSPASKGDMVLDELEMDRGDE